MQQYLETACNRIAQDPWKVLVRRERYERGWYLRAVKGTTDTGERYLPETLAGSDPLDLVTHLQNSLNQMGVPVNENVDLGDLHRPSAFSEAVLSGRRLKHDIDPGG